MVCDEEGLFLLAPKGASKSSQNVEAGGGAGYYGVNMGEKVKWGSKVTPRMRGFSDSEG